MRSESLRQISRPPPRARALPLRRCACFLACVDLPIQRACSAVCAARGGGGAGRAGGGGGGTSLHAAPFIHKGTRFTRSSSTRHARGRRRSAARAQAASRRARGEGRRARAPAPAALAPPAPPPPTAHRPPAPHRSARALRPSGGVG